MIIEANKYSIKITLEIIFSLNVTVPERAGQLLNSFALSGLFLTANVTADVVLNRSTALV
jgi:hypothetical protein